MYQNHLEILLKHRPLWCWVLHSKSSWICRIWGGDYRIFIFHKFPGDIDTANPKTTLWEQLYWSWEISVTLVGWLGRSMFEDRSPKKRNPKAWYILPNNKTLKIWCKTRVVRILSWRWCNIFLEFIPGAACVDPYSGPTLKKDYLSKIERSVSWIL